ncbi:ribonucleases P/MRP protein subunit POP1 isoform X2 [Ricinus communis]|uniref:ribonucleases P/MRP protein subunit POP1 isoform X2 n=1 Tax=Ricinus communis TaxID=3988 RepID=UPI00201AAB54|nr:ribonucleases P/MRP protein subunit POP1 isoform X2 [Ricinus communis]
MTGDGSKRSQVSANPPRKINVQKFAESRASELETLYSIVSSRLNNDFRSRRSKRRRTSAYDNKVAKKRYRKKRKLGVGVADRSNAAAVSDETVPPRHIRRGVELRKNPESGFTTSGDGTKRLRTHVWHAKRFTMTKLWGFHLPLGLQGRGRGSRALLKWYKHGAVLHDASYYSAVQLEAPEDSLMSVLKMVLEPSPSAQSEEIINAVLSGSIYGSAMLHHIGAPISQLIAPVTYMWRPFGGGGCNEPQSSESRSSHRQLWMNESGILINCFSLEGQLAKLEVMGSKAFQLLQKILHPDSCNSKNSWQPMQCALEEANCDNVSSRAVLSFTVKDPRVPEKRVTDVPVAAPTVENYASEYEHGKDVTISRGSEEIKELYSPSCSKAEEDSSFFDKRTLWDASSRVTPPVEENALSLEKHDLRMDYIFLDASQSGILNSSTETQGSRHCPIMLLKNNNQIGSFMGWSMIIPLSWVRVFWVSFISKGAHAIGQREKRWIACEVGLPVFPSEFPDSRAYLSSMETALTALDQKAEQLPPAIRPLKVPIPPPWNSIRTAVNEECRALQGAAVCNAKDMIECKLLSNSMCGDRGITSSLSVDGNAFDGIVARTSGVLADFLNEISGDQLLLFPQVPKGKMRIMELMMEESKHDSLQNGINQITYDCKLCFVRVLLHACKEGVFEEGAVICAPCLGDLSLWTSRSERNEAGFQIPQSYGSSYFKEQSSGRWELQLPENAIARESYRWPIGFVTTGFVRGSKKPVAEALCEAVLLARLREKQWNEISVQQRRKEIYVLVRNLRSSTYRLGVASIVLEQQEDLEFL